ncbi:SusC/RagA family TonB-linked outer membrane protein [Sphingobacterium hungaricum]
MKLTIILMLSFVTMSFARSYSQNISINLKNARMDAALKLIEDQSDYVFVYEKKLLANTKRLNLAIKSQGLNESLNLLFKDQPVSYTVKGNFIVLTLKAEKRNLLAIDETVAKQSKLSGTVVDSLGNKLPGITVTNTKNGLTTQTNQLGEFSVDGNSGDILILSSIGYQSVRMTTQSNSNLRIVLLAENQSLDEVVVTALGIRRSEKSLSYDVQQLDGEELTTVKSTNFVNSLIGKVAGAQINTSAAGPGGAVKVVLRGNKSIELNNNALYVIDGAPMNNYQSTGGDQPMSGQPSSEGIADLNPDDIESVSVLTGPSAAALYGNEGANGVILITTKRGVAGKSSVSFSHNSMFSDPLLMPKFQNTYGNELGLQTSWGEKTSMNYNPSDFFNTGTSINNVLALSTGNDKSQNYFSVASNNSTGILPNNKYNRYNFSYRNTTNFLDNKFILDVGANYIIQDNLNMVSQGQYFNPLPALYLFPRGEDFSSIQLFERFNPTTEVNNQYWNFGDQGLSIQNPYWTMYRMNRNTDRKRYMLRASLKYNITDYLDIIGRVNIDNSNLKSTDERHASTLGALAGPKGRYTLLTQDDNQTYADVIATFKKNYNDFSFNINVGGALKHVYYDQYSLEGDLDKITNYFSIENLNRSTGTFKTDAEGFNRQIQSVFGNAEVGYKNYLFLTLTARNDWDSALEGSQSKERSFFYPSAGLSAVFSDMFNLPTWFTYLKGRGSYTQVGKGYEPNLTRERYIYNPQTNTYALTTTRPNFDLKPEITTNTEFGLDMRFLNNKVNLALTYYNSNTKNQTHYILESGTEYNQAIIQTGSVNNKGVEIQLGYENTWNKFSWSTNATYSYNKNTVDKLFNEDLLNANPAMENYVDKAVLGSTGSPIVRLTEGGSMGDIYMTSDFKRDNNGYVYLNPTTLLPEMETLSSDEYKKLGSLLPTTFVGWKNSFKYDNFRLNVVLSGRFGGLVVSNTQAFLDRYGVSENSATMREAGPINILGHDVSIKDYMNITAEGTGKADFYVYKADNIRLQEVSLEYTFDKTFMKYFPSATIGIVGSNLAMLYNKAPFDPEAVPSATSNFYTGVDYFMQPSLRNIGFNLKLQF